MTHFSLRRLALAGVAAGTLATTLTACFPLLVGGAVGGTMVALDRRTSGTQLEDEGIELRAGGRVRDAFGNRVHVNATSYNRQVLLTGEVSSEQEKQQVEEAISKIENVRGVVNELAVMPVTALTERSVDALVTGKVRATLVDAKDVFANAFKVLTERGTVYLMGRVTQREADRVTELIRNVGGVKRVVRVLEIISEEELQRMLPASKSGQAAPAAATQRG
jgi:osmotically-inducible protein OsmY